MVFHFSLSTGFVHKLLTTITKSNSMAKLCRQGTLPLATSLVDCCLSGYEAPSRLMCIVASAINCCISMLYLAMSCARSFTLWAPIFALWAPVSFSSVLCAVSFLCCVCLYCYTFRLCERVSSIVSFWLIVKYSSPSAYASDPSSAHCLLLSSFWCLCVANVGTLPLLLLFC